MRIDPPVVPAKVGAIEVIVHGSKLPANHGIFVMACTEASLDDPTRPIQPTECGGLPMVTGSFDRTRAKAEGILAAITTGPHGTFTTRSR